MRRKEIIICILTLIILALSITNVLAVNPSIGMDQLNNTNNNLNDIPGLEEDDDISGGMVDLDDDTNNITNTTLIKDGETNTTNNTIPDTGIEDFPVIVIGICVISAIFAYTRIREYNV